jgi:hypothetical protein
MWRSPNGTVRISDLYTSFPSCIPPLSPISHSALFPLPDVALFRVPRSATSSAARSSASQSSSSVFRDLSRDGSSPSSSAATRSAISIVRRTSWHLAQGSFSLCLRPKAVANQSRKMCMISRAKASPLRCITLTTFVPFPFSCFFWDVVEGPHVDSQSRALPTRRSRWRCLRKCRWYVARPY